MESETRKLIIDTVKELLIQERPKKLTVTDIVTKCKITRQTFYYYFEDIPDLLKWFLKSNAQHLLDESSNLENSEQGLRYLFLVSLNIYPYIKHGFQTNYRAEIEQIIEKQMFNFLMQVAQKHHLFSKYNHYDLELIMRYHSQAILGILKNWTNDDDANLDHIIHIIHQIFAGKIVAK